MPAYRGRCGYPGGRRSHEATALGNGISTLIALGEIPDIAEARRIITQSGLTQEFLPQEHDMWSEQLERYRKLTRKPE